jgi:hypothetical protein
MLLFHPARSARVLPAAVSVAVAGWALSVSLSAQPSPLMRRERTRPASLVCSLTVSARV